MGLLVNIIFSNNKAGLYKDACLLSSILLKYGYEVNHINFNKLKNLKPASLNIFLQNFGERGHLMFGLAPKNILIPNQEWLTITDLQTIKKCDQVWCKTMYAHKLLEDLHPNRIFIGFTSEDLYFPADKNSNILHFKGLSSQKNTALVRRLQNVTIIDSSKRYLTESEKTYIFNNYGYHLCPSENEGWGHYVYEAFSCGSNVLLTDAPFFNEIPREMAIFLPAKLQATEFSSLYWKKIFPLRESYVVDLDSLKITLEFLNQKPVFNYKVRNFYLENKYAFEKRFLTAIQGLIFPPH